MIWIFSTSAFFLTLFLGLKVWEVKLEQKFLFSRFLASQDNLFRKLHFVPLVFSSLNLEFKRRLRFFVFNLVPFYTSLFVTKLSAKVVLYFGKIKDNVRGKLEMKQGGLSVSSYLKEVGKIKNRRKIFQKETSDVPPPEAL